MSNNNYKILSICELIFAIGSLIHLSAGLIPLFIIGGASEGDGVDVSSFDYSIAAKISLLIYGISFLLLVLRWRKVITIFSQEKWIWGLLIFAAFSTFWSADGARTLRYSIYGTGATIFGIYLATRYTLKQQLNVLAWAFGTITIISIFFVVALPEYGVMAAIHEGSIRGIYTHKNQFGMVMVLSTVIFLLKTMSRDKNSWFFSFFLLVNISLVILSRSSASVGIMLFMILLCLLYRIFRWRYDLLVSTVLLGLILGVVSIIGYINFVDSDALFLAIGKDPTLSSRTQIWSLVWEQIQLRPWSGYGFAAYWDGLKGPSAYVQFALRTQVAYAHNGFLDILLGVGFVGLSLLLGSFLLTSIKSLSVLRKTNSVEGFWPLLFLTFMILSNIGEGMIATLDNIYWAIYSAIAFSLVTASKNKYLITK